MRVYERVSAMESPRHLDLVWNTYICCARWNRVFSETQRLTLIIILKNNNQKKKKKTFLLNLIPHKSCFFAQDVWILECYNWYTRVISPNWLRMLKRLFWMFSVMMSAENVYIDGYKNVLNSVYSFLTTATEELSFHMDHGVFIQSTVYILKPDM